MKIKQNTNEKGFFLMKVVNSWDAPSVKSHLPINTFFIKMSPKDKQTFPFSK